MLIARNEEETLARCLASVIGLADEVVVGDTGSTDATPAIARDAGATVVDVPWTDDFAAARNAALAAAHGDWVLVLDADEALAPVAPAALTALLDRGADGYWVTVRNLQRPGELVRHVDTRILRLFRRGPHVRFAGRIHESVERSILDHGGRVDVAPLVVIHDGYARPEVQGGARRAERNLHLLRQAEAADSADPYVQYQLGVTWHGMDRRPEARRHLQRALDAGDRLTGELRALAATKLAQLALADRRFGSAAAYAERARAEGEAQVIARFVLGLALMYQGRRDEARGHLEWVHAHGRDEVAVGDDLLALIAACRTPTE